LSRLRIIDAGFEIDGRQLVERINFDVAPGAVTALVGPNGSGKSTILRLLAGLWHPTEGAVELAGAPLGKLTRRAVARLLSFVPQDTGIDFGFSVREVVEMGRHPHRGRFESFEAGDRASVQKALKLADVEYLVDRPVNELSGGERQRVLIARSLATETDILLLDEPTSNLDIDHSLEVLTLLRRLADAGRSVVVALHDLNAVMRFADQVIVLDGGRVSACGAPAEVLAAATVESVFSVRLERLTAEDGRSVLVFHRKDGGI
jgi:iron complex transport system ATP-binding protein